MDYKKVALEILKSIGGKENVIHLTHCITRLRFTLSDKEKANTDEIKKIEGVISVVDQGGAISGNYW